MHSRTAYVAYEAKAARGEIQTSKTVRATDLWRKMLTMLFETGHPWITFKDACNVRSPQQHVGVVHSSNLCTEITLNTSDSETAVCNLGSINLLNHLARNAEGQLASTMTSCAAQWALPMRMLDNVIDINYYAVKKARDANLRHRPGRSGPDGIPGCAVRAAHSLRQRSGRGVADRSMEAICYYAYWASTELAAERGATQLPWIAMGPGHPAARHPGPAYPGARRPCGSGPLATLDWDGLRSKIARDGMRNSNCVAIAPTATISNIVGWTPPSSPASATCRSSPTCRASSP